MPQLALKANEISIELIEMLTSKSQLSEMQFYRYLKDIEKLRDGVSESYLKALANAAYGRKDVAVAFFEDALKHNNDVVAQNYIVYLNNYGTYQEVQEVVNRLTKVYGNRTMLSHAGNKSFPWGCRHSSLLRRKISWRDGREGG
ncbi:hypothetical protein ACFSKS_04695 [Pseudocitrobacter faecalis]